MTLAYAPVSAAEEAMLQEKQEKQQQLLYYGFRDEQPKRRYFSQDRTSISRETGTTSIRDLALPGIFSEEPETSVHVLTRPQPIDQGMYRPQTYVQPQNFAETQIIRPVFWIDFGIRWGEVLSDAEKDEAPLFVEVATKWWCPLSLSIYFHTKLFGWQEIMPDEDDISVFEDFNRGGMYLGFDRVERNKKPFKAGRIGKVDEEPQVILHEGGSHR